MKLDQLSLSRQLDIAFRELDDELGGLVSGVVFIHIRNNVIGKFGIRHDPICGRNGTMDSSASGLTTQQRNCFRKMALEALKFKRNWTHGEIFYDFAVRKGMMAVDTTMESNYNMASLIIRYPHNKFRDLASENY